MLQNGNTVPSEIINSIIVAIRRGEFVPFLGAGASCCGRPPGVAARKGQYLPNGTELADHLAKEFKYPEDRKDLARVAEYIAVMQGSAPLYSELRTIFDGDYPLTPLHKLLARIPGVLRHKKYASRVCNQLIVTTNYDDMIERAFDEVGEAYDIVTYEAKESSNHRGKFYHWAYGQDEPIPILSANEYIDASPEERTVILKLHGLVDRINGERDSFVIREEDYISYLSHTNASNLVPVGLLEKLKKSNLVFLGYGLQDWNVRVILYRIWEGQSLRYGSWSVQLEPRLIDEKLWSKYGVEIINTSLEEFVSAISQSIQNIPESE